MKKQKNNKTVKKVNKTVSLKKSLGELIKDEDGFVSKETILKVGLSTVAALGMSSVLSDTAHSQHTNTVVASGNCAVHTNITTHSSY